MASQSTPAFVALDAAYRQRPAISRPMIIPSTDWRDRASTAQTAGWERTGG
jgi:hypothetical protein